MPDWDSTEAPVTVHVDDPEDFTGRMDDRPLEMLVDGSAHDRLWYSLHGHPGESQTLDEVGVNMSPAEAYHLADDLNAAADACWGAAEYVVAAVQPEGTEVILSHMKAPTPDDAVRRTVDMVTSDDAKESRPIRYSAATAAEHFHTYRADTLDHHKRTVLTDSDPDTNDDTTQNEQ